MQCFRVCVCLCVFNCVYLCVYSGNGEVVAGTGEQCPPFDEARCGDGRKATEAQLLGPKGTFHKKVLKLEKYWTSPAPGMCTERNGVYRIEEQSVNVMFIEISLLRLFVI